MTDETEGKMDKARRFEVKLLENEELVQSPVAASWMAFLNGHWIKKKPDKPGKYVIGNKNGRVLGEVFVYYYEGELVMSIRDGALCKVRELKGDFWWWSERMPRRMPLQVPVEDPAVEEPRLRLVVDNG